jgi:hypothetical protein
MTVPTTATARNTMSRRKTRTYASIVDTNGHAYYPSVWARHYLRICRVNGLNDDVDKLLNISICFSHEGVVCYEVESAWIEADGRTWAQFEEFVNRFRPANYAQQIQGQLL